MHQNAPLFRYIRMRKIDKIDPPTKLRTNILMNIGQEESRRARVFLLVFATVVPLSILGTVFSIKYMLQGFYQSSFYSYFSLLLSDPDIVLAHWKDFSLSIAESVPFMGITLSLITIVALLISIRIIANNLRNGVSRSFSHP